MEEVPPGEGGRPQEPQRKGEGSASSGAPHGAAHGAGHRHGFDPHHLRQMEAWREGIFPGAAAVAEALDHSVRRVIDVGAGVGYLSLPAARRLLDGEVLAVDVEPRMLAFLEERARDQGLSSLRARHADAAALPVDDGWADLVMLSQVFHDLPDPDRALAEFRRVLRPQGALYLLEWLPEAGQEGPPVARRLAPERVADLLSRAGFRLEWSRRGPSPFYRLKARRH